MLSRIIEAREGLWRRRLSRTSHRVREERLTYLSWPSLFQLEWAAKRAAKVPGDYIECGVALGGSGIVVASLKPEGRRFEGYDLFGMIPPAGEHDDRKSHERYAVIASGKSEGIGGDPYYGYIADLEHRVRDTFHRYGLTDGVELHKGRFEDTLRPDRPIAFVHLDCDWYESTRIALERIWPQLSRGGFVVCDDYYNYGGARKACDEFMASHPTLGLRKVIRGRPETSTNVVMQRD